MRERKQLLTVEVANKWLRATEAERAEEEARTRALIADRVLSLVIERVRWGCTVQTAGDMAWRRWSREPNEIRQIAAQALTAIGWHRRGGGATCD